MNNLYRYIFLIFVLLLVFSCKFGKKEIEIENEKAVKTFSPKNFLDKQLQFPNYMFHYFRDSTTLVDSSFFHHDKLKLIHFVNLDCPNCLTDLQIWKELIPEFKECIIVFWLNDIENNDSLIYSLCNKFPMVYFISDYKECFECINDLVYPDLNLSTFLLDSENKIKLMGDPVNNKKLSSQYIQTIDKYNL